MPSLLAPNTHVTETKVLTGGGQRGCGIWPG
jgi:hypothetical protein